MPDWNKPDYWYTSGDGLLIYNKLLPIWNKLAFLHNARIFIRISGTNAQATEFHYVFKRTFYFDAQFLDANGNSRTVRLGVQIWKDGSNFISSELCYVMGAGKIPEVDYNIGYLCPNWIERDYIITIPYAGASGGRLVFSNANPTSGQCELEGWLENVMMDTYDPANPARMLGLFAIFLKLWDGKTSGDLTNSGWVCPPLP